MRRIWVALLRETIRRLVSPSSKADGKIQRFLSGTL